MLDSQTKLLQADSDSCRCDKITERDLREVSEFLKVINEPNRLRILFCLSQTEKCVCEIWKNLELPQNLVSHHLKKLKELGLIQSKQKGRQVIYFSQKEVMQKYLSLVNNFLI